jgi:beta-glucosidase
MAVGAPGPGETAEVVVRLRHSDLAHWDPTRHAWVTESGPVELLVGHSSADSDLPLHRTIEVR